MHVALLFPGEFLSAADLRGRPVALTIHSLEQEQLKTDRGKEPKWVLRFAEIESRQTGIRKRLVLNKTNAKSIAKLHGAETNDWVSKRIYLYPTTCEAFGEIVDCIRIKPEVPSNGKAAPEPEPEPEVDDVFGAAIEVQEQA